MTTQSIARRRRPRGLHPKRTDGEPQPRRLPEYLEADEVNAVIRAAEDPRAKLTHAHSVARRPPRIRVPGARRVRPLAGLGPAHDQGPLRQRAPAGRNVESLRHLWRPALPTRGISENTPKAEAVSQIDPERSPQDVFAVRGRNVYLYYPNAVARSKLTNEYLTAQLQTASTMRNWRTVLALLGMVSGP